MEIKSSPSIFPPRRVIMSNLMYMLPGGSLTAAYREFVADGIEKAIRIWKKMSYAACSEWEHRARDTGYSGYNLLTQKVLALRKANSPWCRFP